MQNNAKLYLSIFSVLYISQMCLSKNITFVGTNDWQEITEGQRIPAGLHVRINLTTGKKEAKLLDETEQKRTNAELSMLPANDGASTLESEIKHDTNISRELEEALKNLPKERMVLDYSPQKMANIQRNYKSYTELKKSYAEMRHSFKSDAEIITSLMQEFVNVSTNVVHRGVTLLDDKRRTKNLLRILDDLKYLSHQIDNALWFIDNGGLEQMLLPLIVNGTNVELRVQAMRVLGALTQNNPKAQVKVFEKNFGLHLAQILITSTHTDELSTALYAFGSLLRKFPLAQQRILSKSGTQALVAVVGKECELKIKAKAVTLINDLVVEKNAVLAQSAASGGGGGDALAAAQYADLSLPEWLLANAYCDIVETLVVARLYELLQQPDLTEYFIHALTNTKSFCNDNWSQSAQLRHTLLTLMNRFRHSAEEYRLEVALSIEELVRTLFNENLIKDEL